jgi:NADPH:quinone reductase-like Zn-dependent oxidoreductase
MRAYELQAEEGFDALRIVDRPEPPPPGDHDVVVRNHPL